MKNGHLKITLPVMLAMTSMVTADAAAEQAQQPSYHEYHNRIVVFDPLHQMYERTKTDAFYAGVETWLLPVIGSNHLNLIGEAELRMGYNYFYNGRDHVTPFLGIGAFKDFRSEHTGYIMVVDGVVVHHRRHGGQKPAIIYGTFGVLYDHEFNSIFNLGVNFKGLIGGPVSTRHWDWGSPVGGIDISLPITFRFGYKRHWDVRIEPFDIYLHGSHISRNYFGFRSTVGYRF